MKVSSGTVMNVSICLYRNPWVSIPNTRALISCHNLAFIPKPASSNTMTDPAGSPELTSSRNSLTVNTILSTEKLGSTLSASLMDERDFPEPVSPMNRAMRFLFFFILFRIHCSSHTLFFIDSSFSVIFPPLLLQYIPDSQVS